MFIQKTKVPIFLSLLVCIFLKVVTCAQTNKDQRFYQDNKNHYFNMLAPEGWIREDYPDPRTKVAFYHPNNKKVLMRIIARESDDDFTTLKREKEEFAQNWRAKGLLVEVLEESIGDFKTVTVHTEIPRMGNTILIFFIESGIHFNIQFAALSNALFEKNLDKVIESVKSISIRPTKKYDTEKARAQRLAWYVRYAHLMKKLGDIEEAVTIAKEGLQEFPNNKELEAILKEIEPK